MYKNEFINKIIGVPWVNRASSFDACDCWGLVLLYYKHVMSIDLPPVEGYLEKIDIGECWYGESLKSHWQKVSNIDEHGLVFTCYSVSGRPQHVGVYIGNGLVIHADGHIKDGGSVRVNKLTAISRLYGNYTMHKYIG